MRFALKLFGTPLLELVLGDEGGASDHQDLREASQDVPRQENTQGEEKIRNIVRDYLQKETEKDREEEPSREDLREAAIRDNLTNCYNRRYFDEMIEKEVKRSARYEHPIGFLMVDVNRFKEINDTYSHLTGDKILKVVADLLQRNVRSADTVVRYGGDEFLIILPETDGEAKNVVSRIQESLEEWNEGNDLIDFPLTLALGHSYWNSSQGRDVEDALEEADRRMYEDKNKHNGQEDYSLRID